MNSVCFTGPVHFYRSELGLMNLSLECLSSNGPRQYIVHTPYGLLIAGTLQVYFNKTLFRLLRFLLYRPCILLPSLLCPNLVSIRFDSHCRNLRVLNIKIAARVTSDSERARCSRVQGSMAVETLIQCCFCCASLV